MEALSAEISGLKNEPVRSALGYFRSESKLLEQYHAGDSKAFFAIYSRYHTLVFSICLGVLGSREDAEDASQEVLVTLANKLRTQSPDNLKAWIAQVSRNAAIDYLRARKQTYEMPEGHEDLQTTVDTHTIVEQRKEMDGLLRALKDLPERQRTALTLKEIAGNSYQEIATTLETTPIAVRELIRAGRLALRAQRAGESMACENVQELLAGEEDWRHQPREVRIHLRKCKHCSEFKTQMRRDRQSLRGLVPVFAGTPLLARFSYTLFNVRDRFGGIIDSSAAGDHLNTLATFGTAAAVTAVAVVGVATQSSVINSIGNQDGGGHAQVVANAVQGSNGSLASGVSAPRTSSSGLSGDLLGVGGGAGATEVNALADSKDSSLGSSSGFIATSASASGSSAAGSAVDVDTSGTPVTLSSGYTSRAALSPGETASDSTVAGKSEKTLDELKASHSGSGTASPTVSDGSDSSSAADIPEVTTPPTSSGDSSTPAPSESSPSSPSGDSDAPKVPKSPALRPHTPHPHTHLPFSRSVTP